ncbi:hypothetical protein [uncultured Porphyromonas sp.]|uniref:hypothetical protein n=1 Tax=uncultured Porphyromonas sp. TaxID=159274 RepID=UPI0026186FC6|nr:hypothetical protein [uncultured Porphyromonas sp.]
MITRDQLTSWADTPESKANFPHLISRLIRATTAKNTKVDIPWGSATYIGGWDGIVDSKEEARYVPEGISLWELGTDQNPKKKADADYKKRTKEPRGYTPQDATFVFVTPRIWTGKDTWVKRRKEEKKWKDVIVYDGISLAQWLDEAPAVSRWFASQGYAGVCSSEGIMTADECWEEWSCLEQLQLQPGCVLAGREVAREALIKLLEGNPSIIGVRASTKGEAIAFILATMKASAPELSGRFFSTTLIIDQEDRFRSISLSMQHALNLIVRFDSDEPLGVATREGHHVLVPLGADDVFSPNPITLPAVDRDALIEALVKSGLSRRRASKHTKESGHDITILKKLLGFPRYGADWIKTQPIREIIPALLLGRWDESYPGDRELLEKLSGTSYAKHKEVLAKWLNLPESPLKKIGETWRLTSPLDLWRSISGHLTDQDFQLLEESFIEVYHSGNPVLASQMDLPDYISKKRTYSDWVREGLAQSLILISIPQVGVSLRDLQSRVDRIIRGLLSKASGAMWVSIDRELPLIAEASPQVFLESVSRSLSDESPEIMDMFKEEPGILVPEASHTGLLWALEELAWVPAYFKTACLLLHKLATLDLGGRLSNRPLNSLTEIFKAWHYQTLAPYEQRVEVLKEMLPRDVDVSWKLLKSLLPSSSSEIAFPTYRMRWRMFWEATDLRYTNREWFDMCSEAVGMLISLCDGDETRFSDLIEAAPGCMPRDRERILKWAQEAVCNIEHKKGQAWYTLRRILNKHKQYPDTDWALRKDELSPFEQLYSQLYPKDVLVRNVWLFNEDHRTQMIDPASATPFEVDQYKEIEEQVAARRERAVAELVEELGLERVLELRLEVKCPWKLGEALAKVIKDEQDLQYVWLCLEDDTPLIDFTRGFISQKLRCEKFSWMQALVQELLEKGYSDKAVANALLAVHSGRELWQYVDSLGEGVQREYWLRMSPYLNEPTDEESIVCINKLLQYRRFSSAVVVAWCHGTHIPSNMLIDVLRRWATEDSQELKSPDGYEIEGIFEELNKRTDIDEGTYCELEALYLSLLTRDGTQAGVSHLEAELASNPESFVQLLKWLCQPKNKDRQRKEQEGLSAEQRQNAAERSYLMLEAWKKIPGMQENGMIDEAELREWIDVARALARECDRLEVADSCIGQLLAKYSEDSLYWPERTIFQVIEDINTEELKEGYSVGMLKKGGVTTRGAFDGGGIEHERAEYFGKLASELMFDYPNVSEVFRRLQDDYGRLGNSNDEMAERDRLDA